MFVYMMGASFSHTYSFSFALSLFQFCFDNCIWTLMWMRVMQMALQAINEKPNKSHFKHPSPINKVQFFLLKRKYAWHTRMTLCPSERGEKRKLYTHRHQRLALSLALSLCLSQQQREPLAQPELMDDWLIGNFSFSSRSMCTAQNWRIGCFAAHLIIHWIDDVLS